jgi:hypothetical protein
LQILNNALLENNCSEQASRMSAMESSTKNAKEMLEKLTLSYNRHGATPLNQALSTTSSVEDIMLRCLLYGSAEATQSASTVATHSHLGFRVGRMAEIAEVETFLAM